MRGIFLTLIVWIVLATMASGMGIPTMMNYQGRITDDQGDPVNGTVSITFTIYDAITEGNSKWTEVHSSVTVTEGLFSVLLGSITPIEDSVFDSPDRFLGIQVGEDTEIVPRTRLTSTGYTYHALKADTAAYALSAEVADDGDWTTSSEDVYRLGGNVGIGLANPSTKLHVNGDMIVSGHLRSGDQPELLGSRYAVEAVGINHGAVVGAFTRHTTNNVAGFRVGRADGGELTQLWALAMDGQATGVQDFSLTDYTLPTRYVWTAQQGTGNVGIGTSSPTDRLDVAGNIKLNSNVLAVAGSTTGISEGFRIRYDGSFFGTDSDACLFEKTDANQTHPDGGIAFVNTGSDLVEEVAMVIRGTGNVGIGTPNPDSKLEVTGDINASSGNLLAQNGLGLLNGTELAIRGLTGGMGRMLVDEGGYFTMNYNYDFPGGVQLYGQLLHHGEILQQLHRIRDLGSPVDPNDAATKAYVDAQVGGGSGYWAASGSDIYGVNSGNVGIGTSSPEEKLHVNGGGVRVGHPGEVNIDASGVIGGRLKILDNGNVGIGTTTPTRKLEVKTSGTGTAIYGESYSTASNVGCVTGRAKADGGAGVYGETWSLGVPLGSSVGVHGWAPAPGAGVGGAALGVLGRVNSQQDPGNSSVPCGVFGWALAESGINAGVWGETESSSGFGVYSAGDMAVDGDFNCNGTKSAVIPTSTGIRAVYCQESPEVWFEDFGEGQLVNGNIHIELDALFLETVTISNKHPMKVFVQLNDDCNGVFVTRSNMGFNVTELSRGTSNAAFSYRVVAKRKGFENRRLEMVENMQAAIDSYNLRKMDNTPEAN